MRHRKTIKSLGRKAAPRRAMLRNLATSLVEHGHIRTTLAKSKVIRPRVERLITIAKRGGLADRRQLRQYLTTDAAVEKMLTSIAPAHKERHGGYTRALKLGIRQGDAAPMVIIEFTQ